jgi:hypothetical protein
MPVIFPWSIDWVLFKLMNGPFDLGSIIKFRQVLFSWHAINPKYTGIPGYIGLWEE